jgi:hypothetical protein
MNEPWRTTNGEPPMSLLDGGTNEIPSWGTVDNQPPMSLISGGNNMLQQDSMPMNSEIANNPMAQIILQNMAKKAIAQLQMKQAQEQMAKDVSKISGPDERTRQTIANMRAMKESGIFDTGMRKHPFLMGIGSLMAGIGQGMNGQPYLDATLNRMDDQSKTMGTLAQSGMMTPMQEMMLNLRMQGMDAVQQQRDISNEFRKQQIANSQGSVPIVQMLPDGTLKVLGLTAKGSIVKQAPIGTMTPEQINQTAKSLLATRPDGSRVLAPSQIPAGRGGMGRMAAINAAREIDPTYDPAQADVDFVSSKSGASGIEKMYNNVITSHDTFMKNAKLALDLSDKFDRNQIPLLNKAIISGAREIQGNPEATRLLTALYTTAVEYARLTSNFNATGSVLTDSAREEALNLLNAYQNEGTIRGLLDPDTGVMSIDTNNRLEAVSNRRDIIRGKTSTVQGSSTKTGAVSIDKLFEGLK